MDMKKTIDSICNTVLRGKYKFVLISGNGGAGKSTFAKILQEKLELDIKEEFKEQEPEPI